MSDLRDLYQEVILDHTKRPRNFRKLAAANRSAMVSVSDSFSMTHGPAMTSNFWPLPQR